MCKHLNNKSISARNVEIAETYVDHRRWVNNKQSSEWVRNLLLLFAMILTCTQVVFWKYELYGFWQLFFLAILRTVSSTRSAQFIVSWWRWFLLCLWRGESSICCIQGYEINVNPAALDDIVSSSHLDRRLHSTNSAFSLAQISDHALGLCSLTALTWLFDFALISICLKILWRMLIFGFLDGCVCFERQQLATIFHWILLWNDWHAVQLLICLDSGDIWLSLISVEIFQNQMEFFLSD